MRPHAAALTAVALLCLLAYAPALRLPLMEDDYGNIAQSLQIGYADALGNPVFRLRATSTWSMIALWNAVHLTPIVYHLTSLALHVANCWLVYFVCLAIPGLRRAAFWAAAFFAVHEGHQEAVMWFSAINELFQFLFGCAALLCWRRARESPLAWPFDLAAFALFACALISKESAVIWLPLFLLATPREKWRNAAIRLLPFALLGGLALAFISATRTYSFRFADGSFSLHAPFWWTLPHGVFRVLWIWGLIAIGVLAARYRRDQTLVVLAAAALLWIGIALLPYSFLTYSSDIPSRQTYLASAGLAVLVGLMLERLSAEGTVARRIALALAVIIVFHNVGYIWTRKMAQFQARSEPTEALIRLARSSPGPIYVKCFPRPMWIAQSALQIGAGLPPSEIETKPEETAARPPAATFCGTEH